MNFEEWYHKFIQLVDIDIINPRCSAESSWDACKEEVLQIIKDIDYQHIDNIIEKIKKL